MLGRATLVLAGLVALAVPVAAGAATPAAPIPSDPRDPVVQPFTGTAVTAQPYAAQSIPRNPFMAPNERSNIHNDAYQTDAYNVAGPLGRDPRSPAPCSPRSARRSPSTSRGRIVTVCVSPTGATLRLIDPDSLATLASYELPPREPGTFSFSNFSGGGYFYLDHRDRAVVSTFDGHLLVIAQNSDGDRFRGGPRRRPEQRHRWLRHPERPARLGRAHLVRHAVRRRRVRHTRQRSALMRLPAGETIANSFAMDESGGVFIVSTHALYRYDVRNGPLR